MRKKLIAFFMIFLFSFGLISNIKQKETEAISIVAGWGAVKIIGAILGGATLVGAGVGIQNPFDETDNAEWVDFLKDQVGTFIRDYKAPQEPPEPHKLTPTETAALNGLLTQQGIEVGSELYNAFYDKFNIADTNNNIPDFGTNYNDRNIIEGTIIGMTLNQIGSLSVGTTMNYKIIHNGILIGYLIQTIETNGTAWRDMGYPKQIKNTLVTINNYVETWFNTNPYTTHNYIKDLILNSNMLNFRVISNSATTYKSFTVETDNPYTPPVRDIPKNVVMPDNLPEPSVYTPRFYNMDLSPLSGLVSSTDEMIGIINGDITVSPQRQRQIDDAWEQVLKNYLDNPNFIGNTETPKAPTINPTTGLLDYNDLPDQPQTTPDDSPDELSALQKVIYWLKGIWYGIRDLPKNFALEMGKILTNLNNWLGEFWTKVDTLIDDFWMTFTDWWQNNFIYPWNTFQAWLQGLWDGFPATLNDLYNNVLLPPLLDINEVLLSIGEDLKLIPGYISDLARPILDIPGMIVTWFVPPPHEWEDVWEPLILLWHDKIEPIKSPFENLAFYSSEYEDVSVSLEFNGVGGYFKILDYQYIKSYREPIKNIIRSFFWILLIFYNLDQVHRLIRNQGIIKTYVRKIEPPEGNKR